MELLDTYTYDDPHDVFERPPYCVKFRSDVLGLNLLDFFKNSHNRVLRYFKLCNIPTKGES